MYAKIDRPRTLAWAWSAAIWLGIGVISATQTVIGMRAAGMRHDWLRLFVTVLLPWLPWIFISPVVLRLGDLYTSKKFGSAWAWILFPLAFGTAACTTSVWGAAMERLLNPWSRPQPQDFLRLWINRFDRTILQSLLLFVAVLGAGNILSSRKRMQQQHMEKLRLNEQLARARLQALRSQIEPHFLFNALNSIAGQVRETKNDAAVEMIAALSDVLRAVIRDSDRPEVPLREEIELLKKYFVIQQARYGHKLKIDLEIPSELSSAMVPSLLLQPIAENAVRHGIATRVHGGAIRIKAVPAAGFLNVSVYNDGPGLTPKWDLDQHQGVGLSNLRSRLRTLYGDAYRFSIENKEPSGVEVCISVPLRGA